MTHRTRASEYSFWSHAYRDRTALPPPLLPHTRYHAPSSLLYSLSRQYCARNNSSDTGSTSKVCDFLKHAVVTHASENLPWRCYGYKETVICCVIDLIYIIYLIIKVDVICLLITLPCEQTFRWHWHMESGASRRREQSPPTWEKILLLPQEQRYTSLCND